MSAGETDGARNAESCARSPMNPSFSPLRTLSLPRVALELIHAAVILLDELLIYPDPSSGKTHTFQSRTSCCASKEVRPVSEGHLSDRI